MLAILLVFFNSFNVSTQHDGTQDQYADTTKVSKTVSAASDSLTGHFVKVNRIFITGNHITRESIIMRELNVKPGDIIYSKELAETLDLDRKKLLNTRLFNTVEIQQLNLLGNEIDLHIQVNERWYTFPAPILDLADRNFNEWWENYNHDFRRLNYGVRLSQHNMRGRNEKLRLHAQFGFVRRFDMRYSFPYIDKKQKQGLTIEFGYLETKNLAARTEDHKYVFLQRNNILRAQTVGSVAYSYRNSFYQTHGLELRVARTHINDTVQMVNDLYLRNELRQTNATVSYTFNSDHRDYFNYPLNGHQFTLYVAKSGLGLGDDLNKFETNLTYSRYYDLGKKFYLSNNSVLYWSNPENVPYMNFGTLGFRRQFVRGYEVYVIEGPYFGLSKTTLKKLIFNRTYHWASMRVKQFQYIPLQIYLKTYGDFGYVKNYSEYERRNLNTRLSDKLLSGTGFGFDVVGFYDLVIRLEYTFNGEGERGFFFHLKREF